MRRIPVVPIPVAPLGKYVGNGRNELNIRSSASPFHSFREQAGTGGNDQERPGKVELIPLPEVTNTLTAKFLIGFT